MPRWRALPEELDPQVREFAEQLRRLVERSGLGIAAVADRTGYSKTSWERYLNGRLLPPRGAAEALAEVTGTDVGHLGTLWELAERAWSRSELRHDVTMEAIRVAEAKAALGEFGPPPPPTAKAGRAKKQAEPSAAPAGEVRTAVRDEGDEGAMPSAVPPAMPPMPDSGLPRDPGARDVREMAIPVRKPKGSKEPKRPKAAKAPANAPAKAPAKAPASTRRNAVLFAVGAVGALLVVAAGVLLLGTGSDEGQAARGAIATPSAGSPSSMPDGVKCTGAACAGKDPETMGCGGAHATTAGSATVGASFLEVRYSKACGAAWARITQAAPGDTLRISGTGTRAVTESGRVDKGADGHTRMIPVSDSAQASACAALVSGRKGCTTPRTAERAPEG
ncbi:helix-turn-helix domain-containing protein [Streptomyces sp. NPDC001678]|uniref:helix-turn-helix domain-containing protein n=1 Tax=Streptomyces sp. NPDC001678 TaxID=3364599 RepID=UPI0036AE7B14